MLTTKRKKHFLEVELHRRNIALSTWISVFSYFYVSCKNTLDPNYILSDFENHMLNTVANSICKHYSNLSGRPDIFLWSWTLKKQGPKYGVQKTGCKKQGHCYSKREEAAGLFSFWIIMTLFFEPCYLHPIFLTWFFFRVTNRPMFSKQE